MENISTIIKLTAVTKVTFGDVIYGPGGQHGPRLQQFYQLVLLLKGEASIQVGRKNLDLAAGQVALLRPGKQEYFEFAKDEETHHSWCSVHPGLVPAPLRGRLTRQPFSLPLSATMESLIETGLRTEAIASNAPLLHQLGLTALVAFASEAQTAVNQPKAPASLWRARETIERRYAEPLDVAMIAREAGVSLNHLIKLFRHHYHETPAHYLWKYRVDRGAQLLRETGLSVSEIAFRTGFQTPFHFSRLVKKYHHLSPRALRREWWGGPTLRP